MNKTWKIWIDTGGTFTDCIAIDPADNMQRIKLLSSARLRGRIRGVDGARLRVDVAWPVKHDIFMNYTFRIDGQDEEYRIKSTKLHEGLITLEHMPAISRATTFEMYAHEEAPVLAARMATRTPLDKPLPPIEMRLGSTKGTNALLERKGSRVALLLTKGMKDLLEIGTQQRPDLFALNVQKNKPLYSAVFEVDERIDAHGKTVKMLDEKTLEGVEGLIRATGDSAVAVALMNSYRNPRHEQMVKKSLKSHGYGYLSVSSELAGEIGILARAQTSVVNAYLAKIIEDYLSGVLSAVGAGSLKVMTSAGGLVDASMFRPKDSLLSGPAGGVVGSAGIAKMLGFSKILSFDMGGTSTDVARFAGSYDYSFVSEIDKIPIYSPSLAIETVAAGGGSVCGFDGYKLTVGPESAGAWPGPACYGNGGPLAITDVNLLLGRIHPSNFSIPLDKKAAEKAFDAILRQTGSDSREGLLEDFLRIANEKMAGAIRKISVSKGYDPREHALLAFGGAGGQHACQVADLLDIQQIIIPFDAGLLSAWGMGNAEIERFSMMQLLRPLNEVENDIDRLFDAMRKEAFSELEKEDIPVEGAYVRQRLVYMRFHGQETAIEISYDGGSVKALFKDAYEKLYGHWLDNEEIEVESLKLIAASGSAAGTGERVSFEPYSPTASSHVSCYVSGSWKEIPVYVWEELDEGAEIRGPALLVSNNSTVLVEAHWSLSLRRNRNAVMQRASAKAVTAKAMTELAELELFSNRFMAVANDMGAILQRTAFSVNVKDRMDFSCAVLNKDGHLVANAPHIPVHLGSLGVCVRSVMETLPLEEGDIIITNHPVYGGSHLPDVTLIAPVFHENELIAFVANRAHHAELGGITPGSMPANATCLGEEGVVIKPTWLVRRHKPCWEEIRKILTESPYPTRAVEENMADLNGAVASIMTGVEGIVKLCENHGKSMVMKYMDKLLEYSGAAILNIFEKMAYKSWKAQERLDDGANIRVKVVKSHEDITFDFTGSAPVHRGNLNATLAILNSAVVYVLRLMVDEPLPLNEGLMRHVKLIVPHGLLHPEFDEDPMKSPAVVGGNTETSQRIVDTLIKALKLAACSQGTMNNLIFGNERFGFYETIGGGVGAGNGFHGADAVHQHMTNTKITDPEVLEFRYPVMLERIAVRHGSGGKGRWHGGNGIVRQIRFLEDVTLSLLSQHRKVAPYGMAGGEAGAVGKQTVIRADGSELEIEGITTVELKKGDAIRIETPGGGGWGWTESERESEDTE